MERADLEPGGLAGHLPLDDAAAIGSTFRATAEPTDGVVGLRSGVPNLAAGVLVGEPLAGERGRSEAQQRHDQAQCCSRTGTSRAVHHAPMLNEPRV